MNIQQALDKLFSLHQFGIKLGLNKTIDLLNRIGNPQNKLKAIHVAGSNGKGSTSSFIASILMEAGFRVGLYTSPHLVKFNERIRVNGIEIPDGYVAVFMTELETYIEKNEPTFFELTTAMAFKYFSESDLDFAVIETGLGGRLDSTNTIIPMASVITNIGLEHTNVLGMNIPDIAYEKSCIIKKNRPVFIGNVLKDAEDVIIKKAGEMESDFHFLTEQITEYSDYLRLHLAKYDFNIYSTPLRGRYQLFNAALAVSVVDNLFLFEDSSFYRKGIANVKVNSCIQGRYEIINNNPTVIYDAAHNYEGLEVFLEEFKKEINNYDVKTVIFGCMKDKNYNAMLKLLDKYFDDIYVTTIEYERAMKIGELVEAAEVLGIKALPLDKPAELINNFIAIENNTCLVVLGSIYLLGDIKEKMEKLKRT